MKYIFFGTPDVAEETLAYLIEKGLRPLAVVTNPDAPKGRGRIMTPTPVKNFAQNASIPVFTPEILNEEFINQIKTYEATIAIVVAYGKILPESLIKLFPSGVLNIHYSLLPRWRGAAPVEFALLHDDKVTGVTIQKMVKQLDAGDILSVKEVSISESDTTASLRSKLIKMGAELLVATIPLYLAGEITLKAQSEADVTYAPKIKKEDGEIKLDDSPRLNWNKYRAFYVWPGTYFFHNGIRYKITKATLKDDLFHVEKVIAEGGREISWPVGS